jgi:phosphotransferase system HPr (HPr) family protein
MEGTAMRSIELKVRSPEGLHARPAAALVRTATGFRSTIRLENVTLGKPPVDARSVIGVLSTGVEMGHLVRVTAEGPDERRAVKVLGELLSGLGRHVADRHVAE